MTAARLRAFGEAWSRGDVEELMTYMSDDCVYSASVGPESGRTYPGREQVRHGFVVMLARDSAGESQDGPVVVRGQWSSAEWSYVCAQPGGTPVEVRSCDLFHFRRDKIVEKDAFRRVFG
jgi:ketosteroid isomerase-like protein